MGVCLLIVFFQVCDALLASSWLISPFLSSGVLSDLIISRPCGGCDTKTGGFLIFTSYPGIQVRPDLGMDSCMPRNIQE